MITTNTENITNDITIKNINKDEESKDNINTINTESTKVSTSIVLKKNENGETENVEIVDNKNNIIQELIEIKN